MNAKVPPIQAPAPLVDDDMLPLLTEPAASAWAVAPGAAGTQLRQRLVGRLAESRRAEQAMVTVRRRHASPQAAAPGVTVQALYDAAPTRPRRPGEPLRARLLELAPGARLPEGLLAAGVQHEWLVLRGRVQAGALNLGERDYHWCPAGTPAPAWHSAEGALLFLRESERPAQPGDVALTVHDAQAGWPDFVPGIQRRVLWQHGGQAALLYLAAPGASVPLHSHGHDEECLMVDGELFLDDLLLQPGDYQLAPAGTGHHTTATDTGVVIYAHGDLDLKFVA